MKNIGIIPCSGIGRRLMPYSNILPKPLITIGGTPLIAHAADKMKNIGIYEQDMYIVVNPKRSQRQHSLSEEISGFVSRYYPRINVVNQVSRKLGSAVAVHSVKEHAGNNWEYAYVIYSDVYFFDELNGWPRILAPMIGVAGVLEGNILTKVEHAGVYKTVPEIWKTIEKTAGRSDKEIHFSDSIRLLNKERKHIVRHLDGWRDEKGFNWFDCGTQENLMAARKYYLHSK